MQESRGETDAQAADALKRTSAFSSSPEGRKTMSRQTRVVCTVCRTVGYPKQKVPGNALLTFVLLLCFFVPGVIYSIWRFSARYLVCSVCGQKSIVPIESPAGRGLVAS
jgi:hypothetical protein